MQAIQTALEVIRIIPLILILLYAAISDYKTGHAPNKLWVYAPTGLFFTILTTLVYPELLTLTIVSMVASIALSLALFYSRMWGGADAKALIFIALSMPITPLWGVPTILPLVVLSLTGTLALTYAIVKKPKNLLRMKIRYLPFMLASFVMVVIFF